MSASPEAAVFTALLDGVAANVPGVRHTLVVSGDGLLVTMSDHLDRTEGDHLAAVVAGLAGLTRAAARRLRAGQVRSSIVEMDGVFLVVMAISADVLLAVVTAASCDIGLVGYEMAILVGRSEATLTPLVINELRSRLPTSGSTGATGPIVAATG